VIGTVGRSRGKRPRTYTQPERVAREFKAYIRPRLTRNRPRPIERAVSELAQDSRYVGGEVVA
jgi:hypothetical protein